jgi:hypothetical protein
MSECFEALYQNMLSINNLSNCKKSYNPNTNKIEVFDCIFKSVKIQKIYGFFYEKILVLINEKKTRIILYSKFIKEPNNELIQLSMNLPEYKFIVLYFKTII